MFRLIGITAVLLALKKRWLALLIPGLLWAFAHTGYVTDPIILRGVELTIEAVILGLFFLRFGLFVTIMSHFVYNAGLGALPLLRSSDPYFVFSGLIVIAAMFAPIIPGAIIWLRRRAHPIASGSGGPADRSRHVGRCRSLGRAGHPKRRLAGVVERSSDRGSVRQNQF